MTAKELAERLNGCQYGNEITKAEAQIAKENGLVVAMAILMTIWSSTVQSAKRLVAGVAALPISIVLEYWRTHPADAMANARISGQHRKTARRSRRTGVLPEKRRGHLRQIFRMRHSTSMRTKNSSASVSYLVWRNYD